MNKKVLIIVCSIIVIVLASSLVFVLTSDKKVKKYNIVFETNGGTIVNSQSVKEGEKVVKPKDPTKEGYVFIQWIYEGKTYEFSSTVKSDLVLTAEWIEKKEEKDVFTVKFNSDGGTIIQDQIIEKGNKVIIPVSPTKEGYNFIEWKLKEVKYDFETPIENDLELKASWEKVEEKNNKSSSNNNNKNSVNNSTNNDNQNPVNNSANNNKQNSVNNNTNNDNRNPVNNSTNNNKQNSVNNSTNNDNQNSSNNSQSTEKPTTESKLKTPLIIKSEAGVGLDDGTLVGFIILEEILGSVEIYFSTELNGEYKLLRTQNKYDREQTKWLNIEVPLGFKYYIKVRYVSNGKYSDFSNVLEFDNIN